MSTWGQVPLSAVFLVYGLSYFSLGLAVSLEASRATELTIGKQLKWLAFFGFTHCLVEWTDLALIVYPESIWVDYLTIFRSILLPLSTLLLLRFGIGLLSDAGPLPHRVTILPLALVIPSSLLASYIIVLFLTTDSWTVATDVWSRYFFYFPGCVSAGLGLLRHRSVGLTKGNLTGSNLLLGAAGAFFFNAIFAGLVVPRSQYGLAPWLNYENVMIWTGVPIQLWRTISAIAVVVFVVRALSVFEIDRQSKLSQLRLDKVRSEIAARQHAESWSQSLIMLNRKIANLATVDVVLERIVDLTVDLLDYDSATIALWDEQKSNLIVKANAPSENQTSNGLKISSGFIFNAALEMEPKHVLSKKPISIPTSTIKVRSVAIIPLSLENECLGVLWGTREEYRPSAEDDITWLASLGDQAVIALEHAAMASQMQSIAVSKERERIARGMHDGLSQLLGFLNLEMQTIETLIRQKKHEKALHEVALGRSRIQEAQADVRESILSLRTTLSNHSGLMQSLQDYIEEFDLHTGIDVKFSFQIDNPPPLSPLAELQLVYIIKEALSNVRKHANATQVSVSMNMQNGNLLVLISDNGQGFSTKKKRGHFGLQTMRERAEEVGGRMRFDSHIGKGTRLELVIPTMATHAP